ncbi:MAG: hypothetical protein NVSMB28_15700 [Collimonas sp.]
MSQHSFTGATAVERLAAIFGPGCGTPLASASHLHLMEGTVAGRQVIAAATNPQCEKGVFGIAECADLRGAVRLALAGKRPLLLLIDSAGARLHDGPPIQGALRALMTELLDAGLDGLPVLALLGRNVFGGASMLAFAASQRCYAADTLLAMSGPRVLQAAAAAERAEVIAAIDGSARCRFGGAEQLLDDNLHSYAQAVRQWLASGPALQSDTALAEERQRLEQRLQLAPQASAASIDFDPANATLSCRGHAYVGAADALHLATLADAAEDALNLYLDSAGHSVQLGDERLLLSQYLMHLAKTLRHRVRAGAPVHVRIAGAISGGIYIAAAGAASAVDIAAGGSVGTLPQSSLDKILSGPAAGFAASTFDLARYAESGIADTVSSQPSLPNMNANIFATFETIARQAGDATLIETDRGQTLSYAQMLSLTARYANALRRLGVVSGDRIAVQVDKSLQNFCLYLAALRMGAIYLPLNTAYQLGELQYFLEDAEPRLLVCSPANYAALSELAGRHGVAHTLTLAADGGGALDALIATEADTFATSEMQADDVALIIYTSGTTGRPKGAMLTHANLLSNGRALTQLWGFTEHDVLLHALPLFHAHGLFIACHCALLSRSSMLFLDKFDAAQVTALLPRATAMVGVPTFYTRLLGQPDFNHASAAHMRVFISGSAPLLAETGQEFLQRTGHVVLERYGMTESAIITSNPCDGERRIGSVGRAIAGVEVRIADGEDRPLDCGQVGGIQIRGSGVMKGYWRQPQKTADEFSADGWFRTGDLGILSGDAYLTIVGRAKDLVISGGYNVYPKEVELAIDALPGVMESAVIGVPDRDFGEVVTAVVVRQSANLTSDAVITPLKSLLANYKVPKQVHFVAELPRNAMGKVLKNVLREIYGKTDTPT